MVSEHYEKLKADWEKRALSHSATKRAVLFKRLPTWLNWRIHRQHMRCIQSQITQNTESILDIGCGYGRVSGELKNHYPELKFAGVELSREFARLFVENVGPCFNGPIEDYSQSGKSDLVLCITLLMYIPKHELESILKKIWQHVEDNGSLVVIEPAVEIMHLWRRITSTDSAAPTGGEVTYFKKESLGQLLSKLPGAEITHTSSINLVPYLTLTTVHHGFCVKKLCIH